MNYLDKFVTGEYDDLECEVKAGNQKILIVLTIFDRNIEGYTFDTFEWSIIAITTLSWKKESVVLDSIENENKEKLAKILCFTAETLLEMNESDFYTWFSGEVQGEIEAKKRRKLFEDKVMKQIEINKSK